MSSLDWPSSAWTMQNISTPLLEPFLWIWISETRILSRGSEQFDMFGATPPSATPDEYMAMPSLLNEGSAIGSAGTDEAPVQVGARLHAGQSPQSAGQVMHVSLPLQMPSP